VIGCGTDEPKVPVRRVPPSCLVGACFATIFLVAPKAVFPVLCTMDSVACDHTLLPIAAQKCSLNAAELRIRHVKDVLAFFSPSHLAELHAILVDNGKPPCKAKQALGLSPSSVAIPRQRLMGHSVSPISERTAAPHHLFRLLTLSMKRSWLLSRA
jgi:hypothetical protein